MVILRIIKQGNKNYYYLEHTLREGKSFRNKRIYLGNKKPKDIDKLKEKFMLNILGELYGNQINNIKKTFSKEFSNLPKVAKDSYIESFMIKFTYNTNRIEGSTLTLKQTADLLQEHITPKNKPLRDVKEAESHGKVFYDMLNYNKELSLSAVLHWHKQLFQDSELEIAGNIRKHSVAIARSKVELPLAVELDVLLKEFFKWYRNAKDKLNPVILAALVHLKFVTIHPFSDGNGRISRLMMNFILHSKSYPMLSIDYSNRNTYYNALERSQLKNNDYFFVQYLLKRYIKNYENYK